MFDLDNATALIEGIEFSATTPRVKPEDRKIFLACPHYGPVEQEQAFAVNKVCRQKGVLAVSRGGSLLARHFNQLWCQALNTRKSKGWTHFAMIHSDIEPEDGWLDKLINEMDRVQADVISAVVPIKDSSGSTSTAILSEEDNDVELLNEAALSKLPCTFDESHFPGKTLLVNTGLWVCDFRSEWVEHCWFEIRDSIHKFPDGTFEARGMPEDWNFSIMCKMLRRKVFATQIVGLKHYGRIAFARNARSPEDDTPAGSGGGECP